MSTPSSGSPSGSMRRHLGAARLVPADFDRPVVTVGMFDGLHRGHQHVIEHLRAFALRLGGESVVVTFDTHPMALITGAPPRQILSTEHRLRLLERLGVTAVVLLPFDEAMRSTPYDVFTRDVLVKGLGVAGLLFGYNSNFGQGGQGTVTTLAPLAERHEFALEEAPPILLEGRPISSTRIRDAIEQGHLAEAAHMLGRPVALFGRVVRGDGRGRTLGFPTANLDLEGELVPPTGVYEVLVRLDGERYVGVANLGQRPTFEGASRPAPVLEVHLPGQSLDLYGRRLEVEVVRRLRDEQRFDGVEALVAQIERDVAAVTSQGPTREPRE